MKKRKAEAGCNQLSHKIAVTTDNKFNDVFRGEHHNSCVILIVID
jgi:hypothetical protein